MIYIFDLDGTLADLTHRIHFVKQQPADWSAFYQACDQDSPIEDLIELTRDLHELKGAWIVIITGRSDECREKTEAWLELWKVHYDLLYMRTVGDFRPDYVVKSELLDSLLANVSSAPKGTGLNSIAGVFEDRDQVVKMYRERGLRVFQVAEGKF